MQGALPEPWRSRDFTRSIGVEAGVLERGWPGGSGPGRGPGTRGSEVGPGDEGAGGFAG